jgi:AcrR family transcriptional regulator
MEHDGLLPFKCLYEIQRFRKPQYFGIDKFRNTTGGGRAVTGDGPEVQAPPRPRGRPRKAAARGAIIAATLDLLAEGGFQAATIDAIAARAGVGRNTIYRRWPGKEELVADALYDLTAELDRHEGDDLYALLLDWTRDLARLFADPLFGRLIPAVLGELQRNPAFAHAYTERVVRPRHDALVDLIAQGIEAGELRAGLDVDHVADLLAGPPFVRLLPLGLPPLTERYAEELVETIWNGIAPELNPAG